jgi:sortase A
MRRTLRWTQRVLFAGAFVLLGYCAFVAADAWVFQQQESHHLQSLLVDHDADHDADRGPAAKGLIGRLEIPRLGLSVMLLEGDDPKTLRRAVGHIPGTPLPGQPGNAGLSGHRDTFFRPLRNIRENDLILVTTLHGAYRYRVVSTQIVAPEDVAVLNSSTRVQGNRVDVAGNHASLADDRSASQAEILTLVTCYPFYFVGAAPDRFIVRAERLHSISSGPGGLNL